MIETKPQTATPVDRERRDIDLAKQQTAEQLLDYSLEVQTGDVVLLQAAMATKPLTDKVMSLLDQRGIKYYLQVLDPSLEKIMLESVTAGDFTLPIGADPDLASKLELDPAINTNEEAEATVREAQTRFFHYGPGTDEARLLSECNKVLIIKERIAIDDSEFDIEQRLEKEFAAMSRILTDVRVKERRWCLISVPTENSVRPEGMSFEDYQQLYYEACARPWQQVWEAQKILIEKLQGKNTLSFEVPAPTGMNQTWATSLTMEIVGQKPINSVARQNMPGSEVFCAPTIGMDENGIRKGTLNGVLAIPYPVYFGGRLLPNVKFTFTNGQVTDWYCEGSQEDNDFIKKTLETDEGASWAGEIGIGTNPLVTTPVPDTLLAEKSFGFHVAIGKAYDYTTYRDMPEKVNVDNGNRSAIHIDLPRIMTPEFGGGTMSIDGKVFFENGKFLDPALKILNG